MKKVIFLALSLSLFLNSTSLHSQTLFTYGPHKVTKDEFLKVYEKNNVNKRPSYDETSIREYLNLYSLFKMKVQDAKDNGRDTASSLIEELNIYKSQLARSYLIDKDVMENLNIEAYERMKYEVDISHILLALTPGADTLKVKQKIDSLYQALHENKTDFESIAQEFSEDKGTAVNGGRIGYISALQIVYPIETVAYNTEVNTISKPFLSQFGFHILKVNDKRESRGEVQVAQILLTTPKSKGREGEEIALNKIKTIQEELKKGASFEALVEQYSEDNFTNKRDGLLEPFGVGKMTAEFEKAAFNLKNEGDISEPVKTEYGYHILKLIKKIPVGSYENMRAEIATKVQRDNRSREAKEAYERNMRIEYGFKENIDNVNSLLAAFKDDTSAVVDFDRYNDFSAPMFELDNQKYTQKDFLKYVNELTNGRLIGDKTNTLSGLYTSYKSLSLNKIQEKKLLENNEEFKNLIEEYKNGIMLFSLMEEKIWSRAIEDTMGLVTFYEKNKNKYRWQPGFEGKIYTSPNKDHLSKLVAQLQKGETYQDAIATVDNHTNTARFNLQEGRFEYNSFSSLNHSSLKEYQYSDIFIDNQGHYYLIYPEQIYENEEIKSLEEARGFVVADYQDHLEQEWNQRLRSKYQVKINEGTLKSIK